ncbi:hypothetical protein [Robiginitalea marina]|uniref:Adhesin domain-containing protein n=1 Tax=Robiginitalea marina TaxID=2954105 RepID=A0ABT1AWM7_9FLAO|nr:hypothetical protein [Robiginitalea marina]MCO5724459.1 hypothetical protein [Robiginitalea marina]
MGFLLVPARAYPQKVLTKTLLNPGISSISINGDLCYEVILETEDTQEVTVEARMEGEYGKDLLVLFREVGSTLFVTTRFGPEFELPNDKLGAHKVISVRMKVTVPRGESVMLNAQTCQVVTSGHYQDLKIAFNDGSCHLGHTALNSEVRTASAPIYANICRGDVDARSAYGEVFLQPIPSGDHHLHLLSNSGNITVSCSL